MPKSKVQYGSQNKQQGISRGYQHRAHFTTFVKDRFSEIKQEHQQLDASSFVKQLANQWKQAPSSMKYCRRHYIIHTDGSCLGNPGPGGFVAIIRTDDKPKQIKKGCAKHTTNNRMELMACVNGLEFIENNCSAEVYTDSEYVQNGITRYIYNWKRNNWKTQLNFDISNKDLWIRLDKARSTRDVSFEHITGHCGDQYNEEANQIAQQQAWKAKQSISNIKQEQEELELDEEWQDLELQKSYKQIRPLFFSC
ncbi:MAG: putative ribonuclease HI [Streblomastix strix]|uniref:ribonuclease H n=1 Tax=Streblomastix strix TaxID=222440 RepID=A0A5J4WK93_9EUKA|nr:MAG: putative ribonuclease HI [Streblomastix strix]